MSSTSAPLPDDAVAWAVRSSDADFDDWMTLSDWLAGDVARNAAYDEAMAALTMADDAFVTVERQPAPVVSLADARAASRRPRYLVPVGGLALAASIAAAVLLVRPDDDAPVRLIAAAPGSTRIVPLADGSRIVLAGGGQLALEEGRARSARLDQGRALFVVRHDSARPFEVTAGGHRITDLGTAFEVVQETRSTTVAVAEGMVMIDRDGRALRLAPGARAAMRDDGTVTLTRVAPTTIAQWRNPRMTYRDAPMPDVAADLAAALGQSISVTGPLAARRFTGTLVPATLRGHPDDVAALLDAAVRVDDDGWTLSSR